MTIESFFATTMTVVVIFTLFMVFLAIFMGYLKYKEKMSSPSQKKDNVFPKKEVPQSDTKVEGFSKTGSVFPFKKKRTVEQLPPSENSFARKLFDSLSQNQVVILFIQEELEKARISSHLLEKAKQYYNEENLFEIIPPYGEEIDREDYFLELGKQCCFSVPTPSSYIFMKNLEEKLNQEKLFFLVWGLEHSPKDRGEDLAMVFRKLIENNMENLSILLMGGERLADLSYASRHPLSLLNNAESFYWPEMNKKDVLHWIQKKHQGKDIPMSDAEELLKISGGHPLLLNECLKFYQPENEKQENLEEKIVQADFMWGLFGTFSSESESLKKDLLSLIEKDDDVGIAQTYITDPLLRAVYWRNLIKRRDDGKLAWRCDAIKKAGHSILNAGKN